jgi:hypothetical protein
MEAICSSEIHNVIVHETLFLCEIYCQIFGEIFFPTFKILYIICSRISQCFHLALQKLNVTGLRLTQIYVIDY